MDQNLNPNSYQNLERIVRLETKLDQMGTDVRKNNDTVHTRIDKLDITVIELRKSIDSELKEIKHMLGAVQENLLTQKSKIDGGWKIITIVGTVFVAMAGFGKIVIDLFKIH